MKLLNGKLGWQTIRELIDMETAMVECQSINNEAPNYLTSLFESLSQNTVRELQNTKTDHKLPLLKIPTGKRCFSYRGALLWNNLSADAKNVQTLSKFKTAYKSSNKSFC